MEEKQRKTQFKWFTVAHWREEEQYLRDMNNKGWKLDHLTYPGFYHFTKTKPLDCVYKLDYNPDGLKNKTEYMQLFSDCGWEHIFDFLGYSYFRKDVLEGEDIENEDIFGDNESRFEMIKRVYKGKLLPLLLIFLGCIIPQLTMNIAGNSRFNRCFSIIFGIFLVIYLLIFIDYGIQYRSLKKEWEK